MADNYRSRRDQYGDARQKSRDELPAELRELSGPVPRHYFAQLSDAELAVEIKRRYFVKKADMSARNALDVRLLRWYDPEKLQDHWQNVWTGKPLPKMFHTSGLSVNIYNWSKPILEAGVGLLAGGKPRPYEIDVKPRDEASDASRLQADVVEQWLYRHRKKIRYDVTYARLVTDTWGLGRSWRQVCADHTTYEQLPKVTRLWPGSVAAFWQDDGVTLEQGITATNMLPSTALSMFGDKRPDGTVDPDGPKSKAILDATMSTDAIAMWQGIESRLNPQHKFSRATVLTDWYRLDDGKIGRAIVLVGAGPGRGHESEADAFMLDRNDDTGYSDVPLRCTPKFVTPDRAIDECQGALFDVAGLNTEYDEVMSAFHDMLWRAIYQRYKAKGFSKPPKLLKGTNIYAMRGDQNIERLDDVLNTVPIEQFLAHLEEMIIVFPGLNRYFLGSAPPSETSGQAITASINASITRIDVTRTWIQDDEEWTHEQMVDQAITFGRVKYRDEVIPMSDLLEQPHEVELEWRDASPIDDVKSKQLTLAGLRGGVLSLDTSQRRWNVRNRTEEQRKIRRERMDPVWRPEAVSATAAAVLQLLSAQHAKKSADAPPDPNAGREVRISLAGQLGPEEVQSIASQMGIQGAAAPITQGTRAIPGRQPAEVMPQGPAAAARVAGSEAQKQNARMAPPSFENNNEPTGGPPALTGDESNFQSGPLPGGE